MNNNAFFALTLAALALSLSAAFPVSTSPHFFGKIVAQPQLVPQAFKIPSGSFTLVAVVSAKPVQTPVDVKPTEQKRVVSAAPVPVLVPMPAIRLKEPKAIPAPITLPVAPVVEIVQPTATVVPIVTSAPLPTPEPTAIPSIEPAPVPSVQPDQPIPPATQSQVMLQYHCTDIWESGHTDMPDFAFFTSHYSPEGICEGSASFDARTDFDGDHCTDSIDFEIFKKHFSAYTADADNYYCVHHLEFGPRMCPDIDQSGLVSLADAVLFANSFHKTAGMEGYDLRADFDQDGIVDEVDKAVLAKAFNDPTWVSPYCVSTPA